MKLKVLSESLTKELLDIGFDKSCMINNKGIIVSLIYRLFNCGDFYITYDQALDFFREEYNIHIHTLMYIKPRKFDFVIYSDFYEEDQDEDEGEYKTHYEALDDAIKEAILLIKSITNE